jgi:hypothetical protein
MRSAREARTLSRMSNHERLTLVRGNAVRSLWMAGLMMLSAVGFYPLIAFSKRFLTKPAVPPSLLASSSNPIIWLPFISAYPQGLFDSLASLLPNRLCRR